MPLLPHLLHGFWHILQWFQFVLLLLCQERFGTLPVVFKDCAQLVLLFRGEV
jgi:hypothetical protein